MPDRTDLSDIEEVSEDEDLGGAMGDLADEKHKVHSRPSKMELRTGSEDYADRSRTTAPGSRKRRREWEWTLEDSPELAGRTRPILIRVRGQGEDVKVMESLIHGDTTTVAEALL